MIFIGTFLFYLPYFSQEITGDEGAYAYIASGISEGKLPYVDAYDHKPPLLYAIYAIAFKTFGKDILAIRVSATIFAILTTFIVFKITEELFNTKAALIAALFYGIFSSGPMIEGGMGNPESFMNLFLVLSVYMLILSELKGKSSILLFFSGILIGLGTLVKYPAAVNFILIFLLLVIKNLFEKRSLKETVFKISIVSIGFLIPLFLTFLIFYINNAWKEMFFWNVIYNLNYAGSANKLIILIIFTVMDSAFLWLLSSAALIYLILNKRNLATVFLSVWFITSLIAVSVGPSFGHYFLQIIPVLSVLSSYGIIEILKLKDSKIVNINLKNIGGVMVLILIVGSLLISSITHFYLKKNFGDTVLIKYSYWGILEKQKETANYLNSHTNANDYIYVWGADAGIYFLADRKSSTEFINYYPIYNVPNATEELFDDLNRHKPKYIVIPPETKPYATLDLFLNFSGEIKEFFVSHYTFETKVGDAAVYRYDITKL